MKCENCKRYCSNIKIRENGLHEILAVTGDCKRCGKGVSIEWFEWDQVHPESEEECEKGMSL